MIRPILLAGVLLALLAPRGAAARETAMATVEPFPRTAAPPPPPVSVAPADGQLFWSLTPLVQFGVIDSPESDDDVAGYFDQYGFLPNKGRTAPVELGLRDGALDLFGAQETPLLQLRLASPDANLGVSGSQVDDPFFNQRLLALTRLDGLAAELRYRRIRTEQLRRFPNTAGAGLVFNDLSGRSDRFYRDRTGFTGSVRLRPELFSAAATAATELFAPVIELRGGYEARDGDQQRRFHRNPSNTWLGLSQDREREVARVGGGVVLAPRRLFTLALDVDHERLRYDDDALVDGALGFAAPDDTRAIGFVPDSDRLSASARVSTRLGDRAVVEGGVQWSHLEQVDDRTPEQRAAGLDDVEVDVLSTQGAFDVQVVPGWSVNGFVKYERRENDTDRDTALFNADTQIVPFVEEWERVRAGAELEHRLARGNRVALGLRYDDISRDLDFATGALRIFPNNALIERDTEILTVYGRTALRPRRGLRVSAELGYRDAFDTGYATELDDNVYGELRVSQLLHPERPIALSAYLRGSSGENREFRMVDAQGEQPSGRSVKRSYERWTLAWGLTASHSPVDRLQLYASLFYGRDHHDASIDLSNFQRYFQNQGLVFARDGHSRFRNQQWNFVVGGRAKLDEQSDARVAYTFTRADGDYRDAGSPSAERIQDSHDIDASIHGLDLEVGRRLRSGLRVHLGYRLQLVDDDAPVRESLGSAVRPFDRSTHQHRVMVGVTLTSELLQP